MSCFGDGGAIFSKDEELIQKANILSKNGQSGRYNYLDVGVNSRLDTIQAAIILEKLKIFDSENKRKQEKARESKRKQNKMQKKNKTNQDIIKKARESKRNKGQAKAAKKSKRKQSQA